MLKSTQRLLLAHIYQSDYILWLVEFHITCYIHALINCLSRTQDISIIYVITFTVENENYNCSQHNIFEWLFSSSKFFRQKGQRSFKKNWRWIFLSHFVDDGKKSNSQSGRIITKRKNVNDENSHSNGPIDSMLKKLYWSSRNLPNSNSPCSQNKAAIGFVFNDLSNGNSNVFIIEHKKHYFEYL